MNLKKQKLTIAVLAHGFITFFCLIIGCNLPNGSYFGEAEHSTLKADFNSYLVPNTLALKEFYGAVRDLKQNLPQAISQEKSIVGKMHLVRTHVLKTVGELGGMPRWQVHALLNQLVDEDVGACAKGKTCKDVLGYKPSDIENLMDSWLKEFTSQNPCDNGLNRYGERIAHSLNKETTPNFTRADILDRLSTGAFRDTLVSNYPTKYNSNSWQTKTVPFEDWVNIKSLEVVSAPRDVGLFKSFIAEIKNLQELSLKVFKSINEDRNLSILAQVANRVPNLKSEGISLASLLQMGYFSNLKEVTIKLEGPFTPLHEGDPSPFPYAKKLTIVLSSEINFKDLHAFLRFLRVMPVLRELNIVMNPVTRLDDLTIEPLPKGIQTITHTCLNEEGDKRTTPHLFALYANAQNVTLKGCSVDYLEPIAQRAPNRKINWSFLRLQECKSKYSDHLTIPGRNIFPNLHVPSVSFERSCRTIYPDDLSKSVVDTINAGQSDQGPVQ